MRSHSSIEIRRCRPVLGTLVEIACQGSPHDIDCAFTAIKNVHRLMSFHITMARQLVKWDYLPRADARLCSGGSWRDIVLDDEYNIRFRRRMIVDLGGIAKGFAVDRAVGASKNNAVTAGIVNAGGDLRTFGSGSELVYVRHPVEPTRIAGAVRLRERAMATSGVYFERRKYRGKYVGPILDGHTGQSAC